MEVFHKRYSCRSFNAETIPRAVLEELLDAARWAPNGGNLQPWRFVVTTGPNRKGDLASAAFGQGFLTQAAAVVTVCALPEVSARIYGDRGRSLYAIQDTAAAIQNLLLAATVAGLGSCWVGAFDERRVQEALGLAHSWRPIALVALGYPAEAEPHRVRLPLDRVVIWLDD